MDQNQKYPPHNPQAQKLNESQPPARSLKIEASGDAWAQAIKPKIRLMGNWLERAGFVPGQQVHVICVAPGILELRSSPVQTEQSSMAPVA